MIPVWRSYFNQTFYSSGTVVATGNTGVMATPLYDAYDVAQFPLAFGVIGADMLTDETNDVTIDWYLDSAGVLTVGTTTFAQMTAATTKQVETWPGDVTFWNVARDLVPLPPYCKITHTLAGTTKSMSYIIYASLMLQV